MPRIIGETVPTRMSFTFTPQNRKDMEESMRNKEFASVAGGINTALRFYYENRNKPSQKDETKAWLVSDDGQEYMKNLIRQVKNE